MKFFFKILQGISVIALFISLGCSKKDLKYEKVENKKTFSDSVWVFNPTGDTMKDKIIGMWLSSEVSYNDTICHNCDSLFTWIIESTGRMVKRNNPDGDNETTYGEWALTENKEFIIFSYLVPEICGICKNSAGIMTDSIRILNAGNSELWSSEFINYPPTKKMEIKFNKIKK
jgi:hypothetical protein